MKNISKIANVLIFIFMALFVAQGMELEGDVRLVGTALFPSFVLTTSERDYYFSEELEEEFSAYQFQRVKIQASEIEEREVDLGNGNTYTHYTILKATLIEVLNENET